jgi:hypothetical protein
MEKLKEHKEIVIIILVAILGAFYWIQIRPVSAKKACSWFTEVIPADAGVTKEQAEVNKMAFGEKCDASRSYQGYQGLAPIGGYQGATPLECLRLKNDTAERLPQPEREEIREATKTEYDKCLRHKGL